MSFRARQALVPRQRFEHASPALQKQQQQQSNSAKRSRPSSFSSHLNANEAVELALESGAATVDLSYRDLDRIPDVVFDLKHIVSINPSTSSSCDMQVCPDNDDADAAPDTPLFSISSDTKLFLSSNRISRLDARLFSLTNLTVLSLRNNNLTEFPRAIKHLVNLIELSIGGNSLKTLPSEVCMLSSNLSLSAFPNPFHSPLDFPKSQPATTPDHKHPTTFRRAPGAPITRTRTPPYPQSLLETCIRVVALRAPTPTHVWVGLLLHEARDVVCGGITGNATRCSAVFSDDACIEAVSWGVCGDGSGDALPFVWRFCSEGCFKAFCK
ncbi:hypothetical protein BC830DRAFT_789533 [Chytriomyces sp. MP71]|nr:hypothetical protein BC830DRAFT_789533 [Chytriomyces sp. MP71]